MGRKVINKSSTKFCKDEKKQFDSLVKVLRPKVYITDSSDFKRLVQELTGNGSKIISPPTGGHIPVVDVENKDTLVDSFDSWEQPVQPYVSAEFDSSENQMLQREDNLLAYRDLESWLLDIDVPCSYRGLYSAIEPEIGVQNYKLAGMF